MDKRYKIIRNVVRILMSLWSIVYIIALTNYSTFECGNYLAILAVILLFAMPALLIWFFEFLGGIIVFLVSIAFLFIFDWIGFVSEGFIGFMIPTLLSFTSVLNSRFFRDKICTRLMGNEG